MNQIKKVKTAIVGCGGISDTLCEWNSMDNDLMKCETLISLRRSS